MSDDPPKELPPDGKWTTEREPWRYDYNTPVERFVQLSPKTRKFLEDLSEADLASIKEAMVFYRTAKTVGKFNLWLVGGIAGLVVASVAFGETIRTALKWFSPR